MNLDPVGQNYSNGKLSNNKIMGKDDFLQMFVTQIKYQDPLSPMQNQEFSAQLANFSQLEELQNMNTNLDNMLKSNSLITQSINNSLSTSLIGKKVKTRNTNFYISSDNSDKELSYHLPKEAKEVRVKIYNEQGDLVREKTFYNQNSGEHEFTWDGLTDADTFSGKGKYTFFVEADDIDGNALKVSSYQKLKIDSVRYINGAPFLIAGDNKINLGEVEEIF